MRITLSFPFHSIIHLLIPILYLTSTAANNKFCMTELFTQTSMTPLLSADTVVVMEELIFGSFNADCNECTRGAFGLYAKVFPTVSENALDNFCGVNFTGTCLYIPFILNSGFMVMTATLNTTTPVGIGHYAVSRLSSRTAPQPWSRRLPCSSSRCLSVPPCYRREFEVKTVDWHDGYPR